MEQPEAGSQERKPSREDDGRRTTRYDKQNRNVLESKDVAKM